MMGEVENGKVVLTSSGGGRTGNQRQLRNAGDGKQCSVQGRNDQMQCRVTETGCQMNRLSNPHTTPRATGG